MSSIDQAGGEPGKVVEHKIAEPTGDMPGSTEEKQHDEQQQKQRHTSTNSNPTVDMKAKSDGSPLTAPQTVEMDDTNAAHDLVSNPDGHHGSLDIPVSKNNVWASAQTQPKQ